MHSRRTIDSSTHSCVAVSRISFLLSFVVFVTTKLTTWSMYYHATIMLLFGMLKTSYQYPSRPVTITPHEARETCVESALQIAKMINLYRAQWSIEFISGTAVYWVSIALFVLLGELEDPSSRRAFVELCSMARTLSKQWFLAKGILRMVQLTARRLQINLPPETEVFLKEFETDTWCQERERRRLSSAFPNLSLLFQRVMSTGASLYDPMDLDQYLEKLDDCSRPEDLSRLENLSRLEIMHMPPVNLLE